MSKKKRDRVERSIANVSGSMGMQGNYTYAGGNSIMIPASVLAQMLQNMAPQKNQAKDFAPGSPLVPYEGVVPKGGPRIFSFPVGINLNPADRTLGMADIPGFAQLRSFAQLYDGVSLCERVILDMIPRLVPLVKIKEEFVKQGMDAKNYQKEIKQWRKFVEMPDPAQGLDIHSWLRMAWIETTQIDALALYKQNDRAGRLYGANILDGSTIKILLDERGMLPQAPFPAYQQYPYGVPGDQYTQNQIYYYRESPLSFTPYGRSRIERIMLRVNQALRKQNKDLARYTEGNVPSGIMEVPEDSQWSPDQIDAYEQGWNALLAGNQQQQVRVKFTQPGMKYTRLDDIELNTPFDEFLLNTTAACYGLSMGDLAFTGDIHKSSGDSQQNMMYRRTLYPLVSQYSRILTALLCESTGIDFLEVDFGGFDEAEDLSTQATAYSTFVDSGIISPAGAARLMNFPEIPETGPLLVTKSGITPLASFEVGSESRKASDAAALAGFQLAAQAPAQQQQTQPGQPGQDKAPSEKANTSPANDKEDGASNDEEKGLDEADKSLDDLDKDDKKASRSGEALLLTQLAAQIEEMKTLLRSDAVRGPGGEFGFTGGTQEKTTQSNHTQKARLVTRAQKLAQRFDKLSKRRQGKHWSASQAQAAQKLSNVFTQLAKAIDSGDSKGTDSLLDNAYDQAKLVFVGHPKGLQSMAHALTMIDNANDKGIRFAEFDVTGAADEAFDEVENHLDRMEEQDEQGTRQNPENQEGNPSDPGGGDQQTSARSAVESTFKFTAERGDHAKAISQEYRRWRARALDDVKDGRTIRSFSSDLIPANELMLIASDLTRCTNATHVKAVFERAREREASPKEQAALHI